MKEPEVVYKNDDFLVLNKPAGLLVHETKISHGKEETLAGWLEEKYPEVRRVGDDPEFRPGIVHRLDKETSGVMVVARNQETFLRLKKLFQDHLVKKDYLALVYGKLEKESGVIDKPIALKSGTTRRTVHGGKMEKEARTDYSLEKFLGGFSLVKVFPRTGRTHQIRVHMASIGHGVVNDRLYARSKKVFGNGRLMLHALSLEFAELSGKRYRFEVEPPPDFKEVVGLTADGGD